MLIWCVYVTFVCPQVLDQFDLAEKKVHEALEIKPNWFDSFLQLGGERTLDLGQGMTMRLVPLRPVLLLFTPLWLMLSAPALCERKFRFHRKLNSGH